MRRVLGILAGLLIGMTLPAFAEGLPDEAQPLMPADAVVVADQGLGEFRVLTLELPTGECLLLTLNTRTETGVSVVTQTPASLDANVTQTQREAEAIALSAYPDANILFVRDGENAEKVMAIFTPSMCGEIWVCSGGVLRRALSCGRYIENERLTLEGALAVLQLYRPEAEFYALELDEEDGTLVYEGNARVSGIEYEFELNARTGRLLEWERD